MLIPKGGKHLEFLESKAQIKTVGFVVALIFSHLDGFDLQKGVALLCGDFPRPLEQTPPDSLAVEFL